MGGSNGIPFMFLICYVLFHIYWIFFWARYESPALTKDDWMESSWWDGHYRCTLWRTPDGGGHTERTGSIAPLQAPSSSSLPHHGYIFFARMSNYDLSRSLRYEMPYHSQQDVVNFWFCCATLSEHPFWIKTCVWFVTWEIIAFAKDISLQPADQDVQRHCTSHWVVNDHCRSIACKHVIEKMEARW